MPETFEATTKDSLVSDAEEVYDSDTPDPPVILTLELGFSKLGLSVIAIKEEAVTCKTWHQENNSEGESYVRFIAKQTTVTSNNNLSIIKEQENCHSPVISTPDFNDSEEPSSNLQEEEEVFSKDLIFFEEDSSAKDKKVENLAKTESAMHVKIPSGICGLPDEVRTVLSCPAEKFTSPHVYTMSTTCRDQFLSKGDSSRYFPQNSRANSSKDELSTNHFGSKLSTTPSSMEEKFVKDQPPKNVTPDPPITCKPVKISKPVQRPHAIAAPQKVPTKHDGVKLQTSPTQARALQNDKGDIAFPRFKARKVPDMTTPWKPVPKRQVERIREETARKMHLENAVLQEKRIGFGSTTPRFVYPPFYQRGAERL